MNNASQPFVTVPQELFGGLYTEATPESLPTGASPLCVNSDFIIGEVGPRPGKESVYYFDQIFDEHICAFADSIPNGHTPTEQAWTNPTNATLNNPASYAECQLNTATVAQNGIGAFDVAGLGFGSGTTAVSTNVATPSGSGEVAIFLESSFFTFTPVAGWTTIQAIAPGKLLDQLTSAPIGGSGTLSSSGQYAAAVMLFKLFGPSLPTLVVNESIVSGSLSAGTYNHTITQPVPAHATILIYAVCNTGGQCNFSASDAAGNLYQNRAAANSGNAIQDSAVNVFVAQDVPANAALQVTATVTSGSAGGTLYVCVLQGGLAGANTPGFGQILEGLNFNMNVPSTVNVLGLQVEISGKQSTQNADAFITVSVGNATSGDAPTTFEVQLPASNGTATVGLPLSDWGLTLTPALLNDPNFYVHILPVAATSVCTFDVYAIKLKAFITPNPPPSFNYLKTFAESAGEVLNLALGSDGLIYQENAINAPGILEAVYLNVQPNSFAQSATVDDREFIAISNLAMGTNIPLTYTPPFFDRLSQVGPGAPPSASTTSAAATVVSITQPTVKSDPVEPGHLSGILWSAGPGSTVAGNVLTVYYAGTNNLAVADPDVQIGAGVQLAAIDPSAFAGQTVNGIYTITAIGQGVPPGAAQARWYFTVTMPTSQSINQANHIESHAPTGTYQVTTATMTTAAQVVGLEVGGQFQLAGTGGAPPAGYDSTWTVLTTPNASQMVITSTSLTGNVATYGFTLVPGGSNPVVGQLVTATNLLNGNGVFNVTNQAISATSPGSFSITITHADVTSAAENGQGIIFGTIFTFDPMVIVGTRTGGNIVTTGTISAGIRKICYSYLTRNGYITKPSPVLTIDIVAGASTLNISNLLPGPANTIARIIHLTAANGGNFYNIAQDVTVVSNGQNVVNTSTWLNDNTSMSISLSFSDGVLLAGSQIDIEGNNLFALRELGACTMLVPYSNRLFAVGEQNKLTNLLNYSFDGGVSGQAGGATVPAGWTIDPTSGSGGSVITSPIFGFSYQISNTTGSPQAAYGMITQAAFQDEFLTPIIQPSTTYSVRVTTSVPTGAASGNLIVDLYSPALGASLGTFTLALASIGTSMLIYTGTLLTTTLAPVPNDLITRIWAQNIPTGVTIQIDRVEYFPTEAPTLNQQVTGSYNGNFESFDQITGVILGTNVNQQPINSAFVLFDALFLQKTGSMISTSDNNSTEPNNWNIPRTVSAAVGAIGPYACTTGIDEPNSGEEYAITADRSGAYIYMGGQPIKIKEEIQSLWNLINWQYGYTIWIKNDITNRRVLIGVPMKTTAAFKNVVQQNPWIPVGIIPANANPTTPNVILMVNYKQINTGSELASSPEVHRSYSGKLIASEITRKWSVWSIKAPCAAFISRNDGTAPVFLGNSDATGKIYDLVDGLLNDDGVAFTQDYITSSFVPTETGQGLQMGMVRYNYDFMTLLIDGIGDVAMTALPNTLDTPYASQLLPDLALPMSTNGDVEIPVNEVGTRLFMRFTSKAVDAGYYLSRIVMAMHQDPWSPVRGVNN
jgi:hypothetical protein